MKLDVFYTMVIVDLKIELLAININIPNYLRHRWFFFGPVRPDQNTGGALFEFPMRTAMHGNSRASSAISDCDN